MNILGVDVGNVIIGGGGEDTSFFSDNYLETPEVEGAIDSLARLVPKFDDVYIISKCGNKVQKKTLEWMKYHDFYNRTGIGVDKFNFCYKREDKVWIAEFWGVTHFVDDRKDVLNTMHGVIPNLFHFAPNFKATVRQGSFFQVGSWENLEKVIESTLNWGIDKGRKS
jgi:hypothetical protein